MPDAGAGERMWHRGIMQQLVMECSMEVSCSSQ